MNQAVAILVVVILVAARLVAALPAAALPAVRVGHAQRVHLDAELARLALGAVDELVRVRMADLSEPRGEGQARDHRVHAVGAGRPADPVERGGHHPKMRDPEELAQPLGGGKPRLRVAVAPNPHPAKVLP